MLFKKKTSVGKKIKVNLSCVVVLLSYRVLKCKYLYSACSIKKVVFVLPYA